MNRAPMIIDGWTYVLIAFLAALSASFSSDEAAKYIDAEHLFWLKTCCTDFGAALLALKMFRSTTFADHRNAQSGGSTSITTQVTQPPPVVTQQVSNEPKNP